MLEHVIKPETSLERKAETQNDSQETIPDALPKISKKMFLYDFIHPPCILKFTTSNERYYRVRNMTHNTVTSQDQVRYGGIRRSSASPRPPSDGTPSASVRPSPRQTPGPLRPYPSDRVPPDANMMPVDAPSAWSTPSDLGRKESNWGSSKGSPF